MRNALKRISSLLFLVLCCITFIMPIHAAAVSDTGNYPEVDQGNINWYTWWNWSHNDLRDPIMNELASIKSSGVTANINTQEIKDSIDVAGELDTFYEEKTSEGSTEIENTPIKYTNTKTDLAERMWQSVGKALSAGGNLSDESVNKDGANSYLNLGVDLSSLETKYSAIIHAMEIIAYSIVILFFSISLIETTVKYEIVSMRGFASVFGRMIFSKIIIDNAAKICVKILGVITWIASSVKDAISLSTLEQKKVFASSTLASSQSKLWVIGKIIDFFNSTANALPLLIMALVVLIVSMLILGKLMIRSIQLAMMTAVSPVFFACASSDVTKQYFKNFITGFLQCGLQIVFMIVVYGIGYGLLKSEAIGGKIFMEFKSDTMDAYRTIIIFVVMGIMIVKPPKFLTNAIN